MTPQINAVLDEIRLRLENAFGPELANATTDDSHNTGAAGEGEAENVSDIGDSFDQYLNDMISSLETAGFDEDTAIGLVFDVADELAEEGLLPPFPEDDSTDQMLAAWLGKAKSVGLQARVIEASNEME